MNGRALPFVTAVQVGLRLNWHILKKGLKKDQKLN